MWPLCHLTSFLRIEKKKKWSCWKTHQSKNLSNDRAAKGFSAWSHCDLIKFSIFQFKCIKVLIRKKYIYVLFKTYLFAIWEWLFGMGTIFAKLLQEHLCVCHITRGFANQYDLCALVLLQKLCKNCPHPKKLHTLFLLCRSLKLVQILQLDTLNKWNAFCQSVQILSFRDYRAREGPILPEFFFLPFTYYSFF